MEKGLKNFKKDLIKEIKKEFGLWCCHICNRELPSGVYCVEKHFKNKHPNTPHSKWTDEDGANWSLVELDEKRVIRCINRVYKRIKKVN